MTQGLPRTARDFTYLFSIVKHTCRQSHEGERRRERRRAYRERTIRLNGSPLLGLERSRCTSFTNAIWLLPLACLLPSRSPVLMPRTLNFCTWTPFCSCTWIQPCANEQESLRREIREHPVAASVETPADYQLLTAPWSPQSAWNRHTALTSRSAAGMRTRGVRLYALPVLELAVATLPLGRPTRPWAGRQPCAFASAEWTPPGGKEVALRS